MLKQNLINTHHLSSIFKNRNRDNITPPIYLPLKGIYPMAWTFHFTFII